MVDNDFGKIGTISVVDLDEAFEDNENFFLLSPPKVNGQSTRHLILQRARACIGLNYIYDINAVSCETFAASLLELKVYTLQIVVTLKRMCKI